MRRFEETFFEHFFSVDETVKVYSSFLLLNVKHPFHNVLKLPL